MIRSTRDNPILADFRLEGGDPAEWLEAVTLDADEFGYENGSLAQHVNDLLGWPWNAGDVDRWYARCDVARAEAATVLGRLANAREAVSA